MEVKAHAKFVHISPKKVRLVANLIAGMKPKTALIQLSMTHKHSSPVMEKLLKSAMANASHNFKLNPDDLVISKVIVDQGPTMKRYRPRAMGRAFEIRKKTSHISLTLSDAKSGNAKTLLVKEEKTGQEVNMVKEKSTKKKKTEVRATKKRTSSKKDKKET